MKVEATAGIYSQQYEAATASATTDDLSNPYVGPRPFETAHKKLFFGRDEEADMLLSLTIAERVVLFHAQSGAGKSSLVNARLIPGLEAQDYFVLPRARVGLGDGAKEAGVANVFVFNALGSVAPGKIESEALAQAPLSQYRAWLLPEQQDKPRWLIFDQFEEILSANKDFWQQREDFFKQVAGALSQDALLSVVFVMRSDFVAGIEPYSSLLPGGLRTRFYMELPKRNAALEAVQGPVKEFGWEFKKDAAEELVKRLSLTIAADGEKEGEYIEPVLLQVVCQQLWNKIVSTNKGSSHEITLADVKQYAQVDQALRNFYEEAVKAVAKDQSNAEERIREWFGHCLIVAPGIRGQVVREDEMSAELETAMADQFIEKHIIRREEARGAVWYELAHDRLIRPIGDSNTAWLNLSENTYQRLALNWRESDYKDDSLLAAHELQPAETWLQKNQNIASERVREFIKASLDRETQKQREQKLKEERRNNEMLRERKAQLEAEQEAIVSAAAKKIQYLRNISYIVLAVAFVIAGAFFFFVRYKREQVRNLQVQVNQANDLILLGKQAQMKIQEAQTEQKQANETTEKLQLQIRALSDIYHLSIDSLDNLLAKNEVAKNEIDAIKTKYGKTIADGKRIPVGVPVTVADKGFTMLVLGTELIQLRQVPTRTEDSDTSPQNATPQKIVYWRKNTPEWQAQYVAYVLMRAGVQVKMIRECGSSPEERVNADLPDDQRNPNLCQWDDEGWRGLSVVVGWSTIPLKDNCSLSVAQVKNRKSWRVCLGQFQAAAKPSP